jgi:hypothetical protein
VRVRFDHIRILGHHEVPHKGEMGEIRQADGFPR